VPEQGPDPEGASSRSPRPTLQGWAAGLEPLPPPAPAPALIRAPAAEAEDGRPSTRELLDREIDPSDFPSSHPPRARSMPPPLQRKQPPAKGPDSFEMLIDDEADDEIMEIEDVELEEIE
jgi:hypothetical protein